MPSLFALFRTRRLSTDQRGNVLAFTAISLPLVFGAVGLAVDTTQWIVTKRQMQQVADSAALVGSYTALRGGDIDYSVDRDISTRRGEFVGLTTSATLSPEDRPGDPYAVAVRLSVPAPLAFAGMFLSKPLTISVTATATMIETDDFCAFALGSSTEAGIEIAPDTRLEADCGLATNSAAEAAIIGDATSQVAAKKLFAFGGINLAAQEGTRVRARALEQDDPLADIDPPSVPNTGCPNITINGEGAGYTSIKPGCFGNLVINGKATLEAGNYVLNRGNIVFGPTADVTCKGCSFFLTSDSVDTTPGSVGRARIDPAATVTLSAPTDGPYAGVLMYQDPRAAPEVKGEENVIAANSRSKLDGILYFPTQTLKVDGSAAPDLGCARLIGRRLVLQGRLVIAKGCATDTGLIVLKGAEVRLIG